MNKDLEQVTRDEIKKEKKKVYKRLLGVASITILAGLISTQLPEYHSIKNSIPIESPIPKPRANQQLFLHPDYMCGDRAIGYTLLTDLDSDGRWDIAERVDAGFTTGDGECRVFFKKGYGPGQSIPVYIKAEFVDEKFFEPYQ